MKKIVVLFLLTLLIAPLSVKAAEIVDPLSIREAEFDHAYTALFDTYLEDGFTNEELIGLYEFILDEYGNRMEELPDLYVHTLIFAVSTPAVPLEDHTGRRFFEALAWYKDSIEGNRDGVFTRAELEQSYNQEIMKYIKSLYEGAYKGAGAVDHRQNWKMIQKLKLLDLKIVSLIHLGEFTVGYPYAPKEMAEISQEGWNAQNTIQSTKDFKERVILSSYQKPVLVKFGLTDCIHCLLLEQIGAVPAVAAKYEEQVDVYKLWWNPRDASKQELNVLASQEGVTSSPYFILYINGKAVKEGYAFPDEKGEGMEDFFADFIQQP